MNDHNSIICSPNLEDVCKAMSQYMSRAGAVEWQLKRFEHVLRDSLAGIPTSHISSAI